MAEASVLANYEPLNNFWKIFPSFRAPKLYNDLYEEDKSKGKKRSSDIMWALVFMFDKTEYNPYKTLQMSDKIEVINEDILDDAKFDWEPYRRLIDFTELIFMTEIERTYYAYLEKMEQRRKLIETSEYSLSTADDLDKIIKSTDTIRKELDNLKKIVDQQEADGRTKGDIIESARERKLF